MPTYRYRCDACSKELDVRQSFSDDPLRVHDACGGSLARVMSPAGIVLKGSGFYKTDNRDTTNGHGKRTTPESTGTGEATKTTEDAPAEPKTGGGAKPVDATPAPA